MYQPLADELRPKTLDDVVGQEEILGSIIGFVIVNQTVALGGVSFADEVGEQLAVSSLKLCFGSIHINLGNGGASCAVNHVLGICSHLIVGRKAWSGLINDIQIICRDKFLAIIDGLKRRLIYFTQCRSDELEFPSEVVASVFVVGVDDLACSCTGHA